MIIRYALCLATKSPAVYEEIRDSGILKLPSMRTLRDYRNFIQPKTGFNPAVVEELIKETTDFSGSKRFITLSFDELKIQADLVYNRHTGDLVGFTDLGEPDINLGTLKNFDDLASHILFAGNQIEFEVQFCIFCNQKFIWIPNIALFWRAVNILEIKCKLPLIVVVCDAAVVIECPQP